MNAEEKAYLEGQIEGIQIVLEIAILCTHRRDLTGVREIADTLRESLDKLRSRFSEATTHPSKVQGLNDTILGMSSKLSQHL